ncbi:MAG: hypothetical protein ACJ72A_00550 [Nocardioidaceae bacterium]
MRGEDVGPHTDLYALARVAYELLTGRPPFQRDDDAALMWAHLAETAPPLTLMRPDLPAPVMTVVATGLAKAPAERPPSCGEFIGLMRTALDASPETGGDPCGHHAPRLRRLLLCGRIRGHPRGASRGDRTRTGGVGVHATGLTCDRKRGR